MPVTDYSESTYAVGGGPVRRARSRLSRLGLPGAPVIGGLWLKRWAPADIPPAVASIEAVADGYFVFTTFSLWLDPARLTGPYTLLGKIYKSKGAQTQAAQMLETAAKLDPRSSQIHYLLGQTYQALGRASDAEREFKRAQELLAPK